MNWSPGGLSADVSPLAVAVTSTVPVPAGDVAVQLVADEQFTAVAGLPEPKSNTVLPDPVAKLVPVMVTDVPPAAAPEVGLTAVTVGEGGGTVSYVNWSPGGLSADVSPLAVAVTSTVPVPAGDVAVQLVADEQFTAVAGLPEPKSNTVLPDPVAKLVPVMVTDVPPAAAPEVGLTAVTVGEGGGTVSYVNWSPGGLSADVSPLAVAVTSTVPVPAGDVAVQLVADEQFTAVAGLPEPKSNTVLPDPVAKLVPVMVTDVPPAAAPEVGLTAVTVGEGGGTVSYVNWSPGGLSADVSPLAVAVTSTVPVPAGDVAVQLVADEQFTAVAGLPEPKSNTVLPDPVAKLVPVMVTDVPPAAAPEVGLTAVTVGVGGGGPFE